MTAIFQAIFSIDKIDRGALAGDARVNQLEMISFGATAHEKRKGGHRHFANGFVRENKIEDCFRLRRWVIHWHPRAGSGWVEFLPGASLLQILYGPELREHKPCI
jgi:hypothetical protein